MKDRVAEVAQWLAVQFPEDRLVVRAHGRTLTIAQQEADGSADPLVRIHRLAPRLFGLSYMRHTGRWEAIPLLQGPWTAIRQALADDPTGLFWFGLHAHS